MARIFTVVISLKKGNRLEITGPAKNYFQAQKDFKFGKKTGLSKAATKAELLSYKRLLEQVGDTEKVTLCDKDLADLALKQKQNS